MNQRHLQNRTVKLVKKKILPLLWNPKTHHHVYGKRHCSLSPARWVPSLLAILIHLKYGLPSLQVVFFFRFSNKNFICIFLPLCMCYIPRHIKSFVGLSPLIFANSTNHKAPDYAVLSSLLLCLFDSKYLPQHHVLKHRQSVSFPSLNVRPYVTIVQNNRQD